jgi:hypothetical protein
MYKAYAYDYDKEEIVKFESEQFCCSSCIEETEEYGKFVDDPCCCAHQSEYRLKLKDLGV